MIRFLDRQKKNSLKLNRARLNTQQQVEHFSKVLYYTVKAYEQTIKLVSKENVGSVMPMFAVFSRLNKDIFKYFLIRIYHTDESQLPDLEESFMNQIHEPN